MKTSNLDRQIVPGSKPGQPYRKDKHCLFKSVFRVRSPPWPDQLKKLTIALSKKISSCPKKCKTFFDPNGLWHLFAANYKLKCNKRQFFCRLMRVLHFHDRLKKQETGEEEENKRLRRRSNRNCFFGQFRIDDGDYDGGD